MNINNISTTIYKTNPFLAGAKKFTVPLNDGSEAMVKFTDYAYECILTKNGRIIGGKGYYSKKPIDFEEMDVFETLKQNVKDGVNFLAEFAKAVL